MSDSNEINIDPITELNDIESEEEVLDPSKRKFFQKFFIRSRDGMNATTTVVGTDQGVRHSQKKINE